MKLTSNMKMKRKTGMTLLELTVVILVLLSLISILFIGARAWKKGSDRSANIMNLRNCQQAMRGHANMNQLADGAAFTQAMLVDYMKFPSTVATVTYTAGTTVTAVGTLWLVASADGLAGATYGPVAGSYSEW
jgi:type II secretory pathway pseudopilin PulG